MYGIDTENMMHMKEAYNSKIEQLTRENEKLKVELAAVRNAQNIEKQVRQSMREENGQ